MGSYGLILTKSNKHIIFLTISLFITFFLLNISEEEIYGAPSFGPQTITGNPNDQVNRTNNPIEQGIEYTDILEIRYHSDGDILYATYWVKGKLAAMPETNPNFLILIDADFKEETGVDGIDYGSKIFFDNGEWKKQTLEWSESESKLFERVIDSKTIPVENLFETDRNFISHSIDLRKIGSPDKYRLIFSTYDQIIGNETSEVFDYSDWIITPNPEFEFGQIPDTASLRQGEQMEIQVMITPPPLGTYKAFFIPEKEQDGLSVTIDEEEFDIDSVGIFEFNVSATDSAATGSKNFKIGAQMRPFIGEEIGDSSKDGLNVDSSLSKGDIFGGDESVLQTSKTDIFVSTNEEETSFSEDGVIVENELVQENITPFSIGKITSPHETHTFFVMIEVLPSLTTGERIKEVLDPWESPVNLITVIATAGGGLILWLWQRYRGKAKDKKQSTLTNYEN